MGVCHIKEGIVIANLPFSQWEKIMKKHGLTVKEEENQNPELVEGIRIASSEDGNTVLSYIRLVYSPKANNYSKAMFQQIVQQQLLALPQADMANKMETHVVSQDIDHFKMTLNGTYYHLSRKGLALMYCLTSDKTKFKFMNQLVAQCGF